MASMPSTRRRRHIPRNIHTGKKAEEQRPKEQSAQARADHVNPRTEYRLHKE
jgi:hypothetical protein